MNAMKVGFVIVLVLIIVAALVLTVKRLLLAGGPPEAPAWVLNQPLTLIDINPPYASITKTAGEWQKLGTDGSEHYKNPNTRQFTMVRPIFCPSCGKPIPPPQYPPTLKNMDPSARSVEMQKIKQEYKCPLCGKSVYPAYPVMKARIFAPPKSGATGLTP
jgi:predicted RNA-binding Zn-ribbon protein involved in translation (DUF1610 family)